VVVLSPNLLVKASSHELGSTSRGTPTVAV
jgi:hypothetical protein